MIDFGFSEEQLALRDLARELFERESPPSRLRQLFTQDEPRDDKVWRTMAEAGLLGITVPERHGGLGGDDVDLALVLEEAGRAALPEPFLETVALAAPLLADFGTDAQLDEWLSRIASGEAIVTVQPGGAPFVVDADIADLVIVEREGELHAVPADRIRSSRVESADQARIRGAVAVAGMLNGIAAKLLDMSLDHVKSRTQFDRPVGSFQAVKHKLANVDVMVESSRASAWYAAYALTTRSPDLERAASVAKAGAAEAEHLANMEALQCHGGIGFTWEHDLHFWLKRGLALEPAYGSAAEHRARLGRTVVTE